jgi:fructose-1,6-bisphosphatase II / sedoheptulose-1,7-bisphosphatase
MAEKFESSYVILDRNLPLEMVRVTEAAAIAAHNLMGRGDEKGADHLAVEAMRSSLNNIDIDGCVVIGEGERDEAPMLYIGEKVGTGMGPKIDIALDPLEGTTILATGSQNSLSVIAMTEQGKFLNAPDTYMDKIAIGFDFPEQIIDLDNSPKENLKNISKAIDKDIHDLVVVILNRPRHEELIAKVREAGARIKLIEDGDVAAVIATSIKDAGVDVYMGIGGAPEGVLAASALCTTGGQICTRLIIRNDDEKNRALKLEIKDFSKKYYLNDLASGDVMFAATGVTDGSMLKGVRLFKGGAYTHSIAMRASTGTVRFIETKHRFK